MGRVSWRGFLLGGVIDVVSSFFMGIPVTLYAVTQLDLSHVPKDQVAAAISAGINSNTKVYAVGLLLGSACSVLGGYMAALVAKHDELLNGTLSAYLCTTIGIITISTGKDAHPLAVQVMLLIASPFLSLLGGFVRLRQISHRLARS